MSLSLVLRGFLSLYLPLAWMDAGFAIRRFTAWPDFAALYVVSAVAIVALAVATWWLLQLATAVVGVILRKASRETIATCLFTVLASAAVGLLLTKWLASFGIAASRRTIVPLSCVLCLGACVLWHHRARRAVEAAINNAWQIVRIPLLISLASSTVLAGLGLVRSASLDPHVAAAPRAAHSVLLITLDTFSTSRSSLYGAKETTTPFLEAFARDAAVFDNAIAVSNFTAPTIVSTHTGQYPWTHRVANQQGYLRSAPDTIASTLQAAGFRTAYFSANWWADPRHTQSDRGWDHREGPFHAVPTPVWTRLCPGAVCDTARLSAIPPFHHFKAAFEDVLRRTGALERVHYPPELALDPARDWITAQMGADAPLFVWIHLLPPHDPYLAPRPFLYSILNTPELDTVDELMSQPLYMFSNTGRQHIHALESRYKEAMSYLDARLGAFLSDPRIADFARRSVVVIAGDHGESFERGFLGHTGPLLTASLIKIPLIIRTPAMSIGRRVDLPVSQTDVFPTILDVLGLPVPAGVDGISLAPVLQGKAPPPRPIFSMNFERAYASRQLADQPWSVAVVDWPWKLVLYNRQNDLQPELYDLSIDAGETHNVAGSHPQQTTDLTRQIRKSLLAADER